MSIFIFFIFSLNHCFINVIINIEVNMSNVLKFTPKQTADKQTIECYAKILPFTKKQDEGIFIKTDGLKEVFSLNDFFESDDDVFFMG